MRMLKSVNPYTETLIQTYPEQTDVELTSCIDRAHATYMIWRKTELDERRKLLLNIAVLLERRADELGALITAEMGKPVTESVAEIKKCAWVCTYYADHGEEFLKPELIHSGASESYVVYESLGVILAVMPWNFPFWQVFRFAAPAVMAGNSALLKHASNVTGCALAIERLFTDVGAPSHLFCALRASSSRIEPVIEDQRVRGVTLTGSTPAGRHVAQAAGRALKKTVLELGGSDPYLILEDADLDLAAEACAAARLLNTGQSCIAAKRLIVPRAILKPFQEKLVQAMAGFSMGDPMETKTRIGPMARKDLLEELHRQVTTSVQMGAKCVLGGNPAPGPGFFYPPSLLVDVRAGMPAYEEEVFGPVAVVIPVKDEEQAVVVANDTQFGLGAAVFSRNVQRAKKLAETKIHAGCCFINAFVRSDPRLPFGGIKDSGYGRELSRNGILEFVNIKTVYVE